MHGRHLRWSRPPVPLTSRSRNLVCHIARYRRPLLYPAASSYFFAPLRSLSFNSIIISAFLAPVPSSPHPESHTICIHVLLLTPR
jgi:hypothetical protein